MVGNLDHVKVKFEYQGHWAKVKVTLVNDLFKLLDTKFFCCGRHSRIKLCFDFCLEAGGGPSTECILVANVICGIFLTLHTHYLSCYQHGILCFQYSTINHRSFRDIDIFCETKSTFALIEYKR